MLDLIYKGAWVMSTVAVVVLFITGFLTGWVAYTIGTLAFGLMFFGMMFVLPAGIAHPPDTRMNADTPKLKDKLAVLRKKWQPTDMAMREVKVPGTYSQSRG